MDASKLSRRSRVLYRSISEHRSSSPSSPYIFTKTLWQSWLASGSETAGIYIWTIRTLVLAGTCSSGFDEMVRFLVAFFLSMVDYFYLKGLPLWQLHLCLLATAPLW